MNKKFDEHIKKVKLISSLGEKMKEWSEFAYARDIPNYRHFGNVVYYTELDDKFYKLEDRILKIMELFIENFDDVEIDEKKFLSIIYEGYYLEIKEDYIEWEIETVGSGPSLVTGGGEMVRTKKINNKMESILSLVESRRFGL